MNGPETLPDLEAIVARSDFVRRLAHGLARDVHDAEDAAQETLVAAIERRTPPGSIGGWLAGTVRNRLRMGLRSKGRRTARERAVARREGVPSAAETAARAELVERLARAVRELREPYRAAVFHRYYDDWKPAEIARRTEVPVATVKSRLRLGLATLRERLDREEGGRARWASLLLLPAGRKAVPAATVGAASGGVLVATKVVLALTVVTAVAVAIFGFPGPDPVSSPAAAKESRTPVAARPAPAPAAAPAAVPPAAHGTTIAVLVTDPEGRPVEKAGLSFTPDERRPAVTGKTGSSGRAELKVEGPGRLVVTATGYAPSVLRVEAAGDRVEVPVRLAEGLVITGVLLDHEGRPCGGRIRVSPVKGSPLADVPVPTATAEEDGRFRIPHLAAGEYELVPEVPGRGIRGSAPAEPVRTAAGSDVVLRLDPPKVTILRFVDAETRRPIHGNVTVVWLAGPGAGSSTVFSGTSGEVTVDPAPEERRVRVTTTGYDPVEAAIPAKRRGDAPVEIALARSSNQGRIVLRILDGGKPVTSVSVGEVKVFPGNNVVTSFAKRDCPDGRLVIEQTAGVHEVKLRKDGRLLCLAVKITAGAETERDVDFARSGAVRVLVGEGYGLPVRFRLGDGTELHPERKHEKGAWLFAGLPAGSFDVEVSGPDGPVCRTVEVRAGETAELRVE